MPSLLDTFISYMNTWFPSVDAAGIAQMFIDGLQFLLWPFYALGLVLGPLFGLPY